MSADSYVITLPWPAKELNPNSRAHRMVKAAKTNKARADAFACALAAGARNLDWPAVDAYWAFHAPDARHRDDQNMFAAQKASQDGVADAIGIDDRHWNTKGISRERPVKNGQIVLTICRAIPREMFAGVMPGRETA